jgi:hypothetical protein
MLKKKLLVTIAALFLVVPFQNCAEKLDLGENEQASSGPTPTPTPAPTGPTTTPTPTPVPSGPAPAITSQSSNVIQNEGTSLQLYIVVSNLTSFTVSWTKNGTLISGASSTSLNFASLTLADAGTYQARVTAPGVNLLSQPIAVTVNASQQRFNLPSLTYAGAQWAVITYSYQTNVFHTETAAAFCRYQMGATATLVDFRVASAASAVGRFAFQTDPQVGCFFTAIAQNFCAVDFTGLGIQHLRFDYITCRRP